jgi:hypothetical protein
VVEFIGPFALMFIGGGAIIATAGGDLVAIALAHGLAIALMVAAAGHITGGIYNPALTVGLLVTRRLPIDKGIVYIVSGGGGVARHVYDGNTLIESGVDGYAGGGLVYALSPRAGLRLDGRVHFLSGGVAEGQGVSPRGALSGGIFFTF